MSGECEDLVRGALWANDLTRIHQPAAMCGEHAVVEVLAGRLALQLARALNVSELTVQTRLQRGCRAFAVWHWRSEELVSWLWVSTFDEYAPPLRCCLRIPDGECYGWGAGTTDGHRGLGLFTRVLEQAAWQMAKEGRSTMWAGILDGNQASQRACSRAGMRPIVRLLAVHEPAPTRLLAWPVDYADSRLVSRANHLLSLIGGRAMQHR